MDYDVAMLVYLDLIEARSAHKSVLEKIISNRDVKLVFGINESLYDHINDATDSGTLEKDCTQFDLIGLNFEFSTVEILMGSAILEPELTELERVEFVKHDILTQITQAYENAIIEGTNNSDFEVHTILTSGRVKKFKPHRINGFYANTFSNGNDNSVYYFGSSDASYEGSTNFFTGYGNNTIHFTKKAPIILDLSIDTKIH